MNLFKISKKNKVDHLTQKNKVLGIEILIGLVFFGILALNGFSIVLYRDQKIGVFSIYKAFSRTYSGGAYDKGIVLTSCHITTQYGNIQLKPFNSAYFDKNRLASIGGKNSPVKHSLKIFGNNLHKNVQISFTSENNYKATTDNESSYLFTFEVEGKNNPDLNLPLTTQGVIVINGYKLHTDRIEITNKKDYELIIFRPIFFNISDKVITLSDKTIITINSNQGEFISENNTWEIRADINIKRNGKETRTGEVYFEPYFGKYIKETPITPEVDPEEEKKKKEEKWRPMIEEYFEQMKNDF